MTTDREDEPLLQRAYNALNGLDSLETVAALLRSGAYTPAYLQALANRLDPAWNGTFDEFRLMLQKRKTARYQDTVDVKRREKMDMLFDVMNEMLDARLSGADIEAVAAELMSKYGRSRSWVFDVAKVGEAL